PRLVVGRRRGGDASGVPSRVDQAVDVGSHGHGAAGIGRGSAGLRRSGGQRPGQEQGDGGRGYLESSVHGCAGSTSGWDGLGFFAVSGRLFGFFGFGSMARRMSLRERFGLRSKSSTNAFMRL